MDNKVGIEREIPEAASLEAIRKISGSGGPQPLRVGTGLNVQIYVERYGEDIEFLSKKHSQDEGAKDLSKGFTGIDKYRNEAGMLEILGLVASRVSYSGVHGDEIVPKLEYRDDKNRIVCVTYFGQRTLSDLINDLENEAGPIPFGERLNNINSNLVDSLVLMSKIGDSAIEKHLEKLRLLESTTMGGSPPLEEKIVGSYLRGAVKAGGKFVGEISKEDLNLLIESFKVLKHYFDSSIPKGKEYFASVISTDPIIDNVVYAENGNPINEEAPRPSFRRLKHVDFSHSRIGKLDTDTFMFNSSHFGLDHQSVRHYVDKFWFKRLEALGIVREQLGKRTGGWTELSMSLRRELRKYRYITWTKEALRRIGLRQHFEDNHPELFEDYMVRAYNLQGVDEISNRSSDFNRWYFGVLQNSLGNAVNSLTEGNNDEELKSITTINRLCHKYLPLSLRSIG